jgi:hypothetical protein
MEIDADLKPRIIRAIENLMKNQSEPDCGINTNDPEVQSALLQHKGGFGRERVLSKDSKIVVTVRWNRKELFFACSIAFLKKQKGAKWYCEGRFDDAHDCRHFDADFAFGQTKMFSGEFAEFKAQCPILIQIINSLPKEKAEEWKIKLFREIAVGNRKKKEYLENPKRIQLRNL